MQRPRNTRTVMITGASAGVGRATVRRFADAGYNIGLIARGNDGLLAAAQEVVDRGMRALVLPCDVSDADAVDDAAQRVEEELGPIDVWVNNAMVSVFSPIHEMTAAEFKRVTEVTYLGYVYGTLAALKRMRERNRGVIVQVGSALAYRSIPLQSAYCAAKHAIVGFTDSLRCELYHDKSNIHATVVHMPALNTPQFAWVKSRIDHRAQPVPPIYAPEVAADAIYFAAHHRRRELWVGLSTVKAIIGDKIAPGYLDRYLGRHGYESQQTDEPDDADRPDNLWHPVDADGRGDFGAHGDFTRRSREFSPQLAFAKSRSWLRPTAMTGAAVALGWTVSRAIYNRFCDDTNAASLLR